jgi:hypothetical protein
MAILFKTYMKQDRGEVIRQGWRRRYGAVPVAMSLDGTRIMAIGGGRGAAPQALAAPSAS